MNSIQIKEILRRERDADNLVFVRDKSPEFYFHGGSLKFPLFKWPNSQGFTLVLWFRHNFQLVLKGQDTWHLGVSQNLLCLNGSSYPLKNVEEWNFLSVSNSPKSLKICINCVMIPNVAATYPETRQWDDCSLGSTSGVADFVIFKQVQNEVYNVSYESPKEMQFSGYDIQIINKDG